LYLRDAYAGVESMHNRGVIHGDLKSDNLLLDGEGELKVGDFGLARALERGSDGDQLSFTGDDRRLGTPTMDDCCVREVCRAF
jgi:serine/threonine-protein kinase RIM15